MAALRYIRVMAGRFIRWRLRTLGSLFSSAQERSRRTYVITRLAGAICLALLVTLVGLVSAQTLESRVADALSVVGARRQSAGHRGLCLQRLVESHRPRAAAR